MRQTGSGWTSSVRPAYLIPYNGNTVSADWISKTVSFESMANHATIAISVSFNLAVPHSHIQLEGLAVYTRAPFTHLYTFDPNSGNLTEQNYRASPGGIYLPPFDQPLVLADNEGRCAIAVYLPYTNARYLAGMRLGDCSGDSNCTNQIDCNFWDYDNPPAGLYQYQCWIPTGNLEAVQAQLRALIVAHPPTACRTIPNSCIP